MKILKGDTVKILYGNDAGTTGKVLAVDRKNNTVIVEGKNLHTKHIKGDGQSRKSQVVKIIKPMPISKVMVVDQATGKPTRLGYMTEGDNKVRTSKKTGKSIDGLAVKSTKKKDTEEKGKSDKKEDKKETEKVVKKEGKETTKKSKK